THGEREGDECQHLGQTYQIATQRGHLLLHRGEESRGHASYQAGYFFDGNICQVPRHAIGTECLLPEDAARYYKVSLGVAIPAKPRNEHLPAKPQYMTQRGQPRPGKTAPPAQEC